MKVYEGTIITCDEKNSITRYLVEDKGRIVFLGDRLPEKYQACEKVALGKKALLPSFADTHLHFSSHSFFTGTLDVREAASNRQMLKMLVDYYASRHPKFILAFGASAHSVSDKRLVSRKEIDKALDGVPVMIIKYDGHASLNSSAMLAMLPEKIRNLRGYHADSGELNQEAFFAATDFITKKVSPVTLVRNMLGAYDQLAAKGIGLIHTVEGVGFPRDLDVDMARFVARGLRNNFQTRVFFQTMDVGKVLKRKLPRIGGCFATALDGCFGSEDAALLEPYRNNPSNKGILFYSQEQVDSFCKRANRAGLQIEMHAIGDAAFDQAVRGIESALKDFPRDDHRHTIIHACLPTMRGLGKCARLGIGIAAQSAFLNWPLEPDEFIESLLGKRTKNILPLKTMRKLGIHVSFGSDAPCTIPDPVTWIYNACNHPVAGESVSIADALRMATYEAAWTGFDDIDRGSLAVGKISDMVIMNENPLAVPVKKLMKLKVEKLIVSGKPYKSGQGLCELMLRGIAGRKKRV